MNEKFEARQAARFLRSLRVATQTTLAHDDLQRAHGRAGPFTSFTALAARGAGEWRFPADGLLSGDGLVLAQLLREGEAGKALALQAQGAAGLATYATRGVRVNLGDVVSVEGSFDRDGQMRIDLEGHELEESELSRLEIEFLDAAL